MNLRLHGDGTKECAFELKPGADVLGALQEAKVIAGNPNHLLYLSLRSPEDMKTIACRIEESHEVWFTCEIKGAIIVVKVGANSDLLVLENDMRSASKGEVGP